MRLLTLWTKALNLLTTTLDNKCLISFELNKLGTNKLTFINRNTLIWFTVAKQIVTNSAEKHQVGWIRVDCSFSKINTKFLRE